MLLGEVVVAVIHCCEVTRGKVVVVRSNRGNIDHETMMVSHCCRLYGPNSLGAVSWFIYDVLQHNPPETHTCRVGLTGM